MNKRYLSIVIIALLLALLTITFIACDNLNVGESIDGTYYYYKNISLDKAHYITLQDGRWSDSDDMSGTYKVADGKIEFYANIFGENQVLYVGTIKDGVMKLDIMGMECYYCKEGKTPPNNSADDNPTATVKKCTVTYNGNGGTFSDGSVTYTQSVEEKILLTAPTSPTRQGYSFIGWSKKKNSSDMWQFSEDKVTEDVTLYAVWTEKTAVILSVDGASIGDNSIFMVVNKDTDYVSLSTKVVCSSDSTWRLYYDKLGLTEIPTKIATQKTGELNNGDNIFYIVVTSQDGTQVNTYELTIHRSYLININYVGVYGTTIETKSTYSGYDFAVTYAPSITGYTFNHWKDSNGKKVTTFTPYSSTMLYADCMVNTYTATLDVNGGNTLSKTSYSITYDKSYSFPKPSKTGYTFLGWYVGSTQITDANGNSLSNWNFASNTTVTAKWQANSYKVTLNTNNSSAGSLSGGGEHNYDSTVTITANSNNGYTWVGWYDSKGNLVSDNTSYSFKMGFDVSYTAKWEYYTLTISRNNTAAGTVSSYSNTKVTAGKSVTITATTNNGYTFVGWYDDSNLLSDSNSYTFIMPKENKSYIAKWSKVTLANDNTSAGSVTLLNGKYNVGDEMTVTATPNLGYSFVGWYDSEIELTNELSYTFTMPSENVIYTAKWNMNEEMLPYIFESTTTTLTITGVNDKTINRIELPNYVTKIGNSAFSNCSNLESILIPSSVTSIQYKAFSNCSSLKSILIPSDLMSMESDVFLNCIQLSIYCETTSKPNGWSDSVYGRWNSGNRPVVWNCKEFGITEDGIKWGLTNAGTIAIAGYCGASVELVIPSTINGSVVKSIVGYAFKGLSDISSIEIPSSVTSIGKSALEGCTNITNAIIPTIAISYMPKNKLETVVINGGKTIFFREFSDFSSLKSVEILDGVTKIEGYVFSGCSNLESVIIPMSVVQIDDYAFPAAINRSLIIYCEASDKPSGWSDVWNNSRYTVIWGYKNNEII